MSETINFVSVSSDFDTGTSGTTVTPALPAGAATGDTLIAIYGSRIDPDVPSGWEPIAAASSHAPSPAGPVIVVLSAWRRRIADIATEPTSFAFVQQGALGTHGAAVFCYRGDVGDIIASASHADAQNSTGSLIDAALLSEPGVGRVLRAWRYGGAAGAADVTLPGGVTSRLAVHSTLTNRTNLVCGDAWNASTSDIALASLSTNSGSYSGRLGMTMLLLPGASPAHSAGSRVLGASTRGAYNETDQSVSVIRPGVKNGDVLLAAYRSRTAPAAPSGWTQIGTVDNGGSEPIQPLTIYRRDVTDASTEPVTVTMSQSASGTGRQAVAVVAVRPNGLLDVLCQMGSHTAGTSGTPIEAPGIGSAPAGRILRFFSSLSNTVPTLPSGLTLIAQTRVNSNNYQHITVGGERHATAGAVAVSELALSSRPQRTGATLVLSQTPPGVGTLATARAEARGEPAAGVGAAASGVLGTARAEARASGVHGVAAAGVATLDTARAAAFAHAVTGAGAAASATLGTVRAVARAFAFVGIRGVPPFPLVLGPLALRARDTGSTISLRSTASTVSVISTASEVRHVRDT